MRRTAILISSLPEPTARGLLSRLTADQRRQVRRAMATLDDVDALERHRAMESFTTSLRRSVATPLEVVATPPAPAAAAPAPAPTPPEVVSDRPLSFLHGVDPGRLYRTLCTEHPQTVAVVLASLPPSTAAGLLQRMPPTKRTETIARIGRLGELDNDVAADIAGTLREKFDPPPDAAGQRSATPRPTGRLSEILSQMPGSVAGPAANPPPSVAATLPPPNVATEASDQVDRLRRVAEIEPAGPEPLGPATLPFEPPKQIDDEPDTSLDDAAVERLLVSLPPLRLCAALGQVDTVTAVRTLQGLPSATVKAALSALPRSVARGVRRQIAAVDGVSLRQIDEAKREVATLASRPAAAAA